MTEKTEKSKSGAGKFFLGAALGAAAGAIASKFVSVEVDKGEETDEDEKCSCCSKSACKAKCPCCKSTECDDESINEDTKSSDGAEATEQDTDSKEKSTDKKSSPKTTEPSNTSAEPDSGESAKPAKRRSPRKTSTKS